MRFPTMWYVRPAKPQISLRIRAARSEPLLVANEYSMIVKVLTEHHLEFLSLKAGCRGSSKPTLFKMSNCWKSHALAQMLMTCPYPSMPYLFLMVGIFNHLDNLI